MFCPNCGTQVVDSASFCPQCGAALKARQSNPVPPASEPVNNYSGHSSNSYTPGNDYNSGYQASGNNYGGYNSGYQASDNNYSSYNSGYDSGFGSRGNGGPALTEDRSLLTYILLSLVTCGIYSYYFIYKIAQDVNTACSGDGKNTGGLAAFILLSIVTCGIYSWIWYYNLGNRLAENAPRYGLSFQENGTTVLLWMLFGSMLCGIGPFVAMNILIKNTNAICHAYNTYR